MILNLKISNSYFAASKKLTFSLLSILILNSFSQEIFLTTESPSILVKSSVWLLWAFPSNSLSENLKKSIFEGCSIKLFIQGDICKGITTQNLEPLKFTKLFPSRSCKDYFNFQVLEWSCDTIKDKTILVMVESKSHTLNYRIFT